MTLQQINDIAQIGGFSFLIILLGMIKIPHIEINFWKWLARKFGSAINGEVLDQVADLKEDLDEFKKISDVIIVNRMDDKIKDVIDKIYCRDLFFRD